MTRGQFIFVCSIGALALVAYLQSYRTAAALVLLPGMPKPGSWTA